MATLPEWRTYCHVAHKVIHDLVIIVKVAAGHCHVVDWVVEGDAINVGMQYIIEVVWSPAHDEEHRQRDDRLQDLSLIHI